MGRGGGGDARSEKHPRPNRLISCQLSRTSCFMLGRAVWATCLFGSQKLNPSFEDETHSVGHFNLYRKNKAYCPNTAYYSGPSFY